MMAIGLSNPAIQQSSKFRLPTVSKQHSPERMSAKNLSKGYFSSNTAANYAELAEQIARLMPSSAQPYCQRPVILLRHMLKAAISTVAQAAKLTFMGPLAYGIEAASGVDIPTIRDAYSGLQDIIHNNHNEIAALDERNAHDTNLKLEKFQTSGNALDNLAQSDPVFKDKISSAGTTHIDSHSGKYIYIKGGNIDDVLDENDEYVIIKGGGHTGPTLNNGYDNDATIAIKKEDISSVNKEEGRIRIEFKDANTAYDYVNGDAAYYNPRPEVGDYNYQMDLLQKTKVVPADEVRNSGNPSDGYRIVTDYPESVGGFTADYKLPESLYKQAGHLLDHDTNLSPEQKTALENFTRAYEDLKPGYDANVAGMGLNDYYSNPEFANQYGPLYDERAELARNEIITTTALGAGAGMYAATEIDAILKQQQKTTQSPDGPALPAAASPAAASAAQNPNQAPRRHERTLLGKIMDWKQHYLGSLFSTVSYTKDVFSIKKAIRSDCEAIGDHTGKVAIASIANEGPDQLLASLNTQLQSSDTIQTPAQLMAKAFFQNPNLSSLGLRSELAKFALQRGLLTQFSSTPQASNSASSPQMTQHDVVQLLLDGGRYASAYKYAKGMETTPTATAWQRARAALDAVGNGLLCIFRTMMTATILLPAASIVFYRLLNVVSWKEAYETVRDGTKRGITHSADKAQTLVRFAKNGLVTS